MLSLAWQATGIGIHAHFNHNDIFHVLFMIGLGTTTYGLSAQLAAAVGVDVGTNEPLSPGKDAEKGMAAGQKKAEGQTFGRAALGQLNAWAGMFFRPEPETVRGY